MLRWLPATLMFAALDAQGPTLALVRDPERFVEVVDLHGLRCNVLGEDAVHAATSFGLHIAQFLRTHAQPALSTKRLTAGTTLRPGQCAATVTATRPAKLLDPGDLVVVLIRVVD